MTKKHNPQRTYERRTMKNFHDDIPPSTFFAVFNDLSGASLFTTVGGGYYDVSDMFDVPDIHWFTDAGYLWFFEVDDIYVKMALEGVK